MASAPLETQKAIIRCFVAGAKANPKERRVEVSFYQVPFPREVDSRVPYVAMPEVRVVNVPTLRRVWVRSIRVADRRVGKGVDNIRVLRY